MKLDYASLIYETWHLEGILGDFSLPLGQAYESFFVGVG